MNSMTEIGPDLSRAATILMRDMMCVVPGEHVLITSDINSERRAVEALANATHGLGARVATMILSPPST